MHTHTHIFMLTEFGSCGERKSMNKQRRKRVQKKNVVHFINCDIKHWKMGFIFIEYASIRAKWNT